jgi:hypothetical protein
MSHAGNLRIIPTFVKEDNFKLRHYQLTKQLFDLKVKIKQIDKALKVLDPQETTTETPGKKD